MFVGPDISDNRVKFGDPFSRNQTRSRLRQHFRLFFRCSFRPEVVSDIISGAYVGQVGMDVPIKFGDFSFMVHEIYSSKDIRCDIFDRFLNCDNCQPEVVNDVISCMVDLMSVWMYVPIFVMLG